jgi:hypothetical protein
MNSNNSKSNGYFDSSDCANLIVECENDPTPRPCPPKLLELLKAEREKLIRWGEITEETVIFDADE